MGRLMPRKLVLDQVERTLARLFNWRVLGYVMLGAGLLLAGGFFDVIAHGRPAISRYGSIIPAMEVQTSSEMMLVALGYGMGALGLYLLYSSQKHTHNPKYVNTLMILGSALTALAVALLMLAFAVKTGW